MSGRAWLAVGGVVVALGVAAVWKSVRSGGEPPAELPSVKERPAERPWPGDTALQERAQAMEEERGKMAEAQAESGDAAPAAPREDSSRAAVRAKLEARIAVLEEEGASLDHEAERLKTTARSDPAVRDKLKEVTMKRRRVTTQIEVARQELEAMPVE